MHLLAIAVLCVTLLRAQDVEPARLALGMNVIGGQIDFRLNDRWQAEGRFVTGGNSGTVSSRVYGLRAYRLYRAHAIWRPYWGLEGDYVTASAAARGHNVDGAALGGFAGLETRLLSRTWFGIDIGPYAIHLKGKSFAKSDTSILFVLNSFIAFYIW